jgi:hypothetical protein
VVIALFTVTTEFVALTGGLASLAFSYSSILGIGVAIGYALLAWLSSPTWIKVAAVSAAVPCLALLVLALISAILYPMRALIGTSINSCLTRAVRSEKGILLFIATGATLLSATVIMVTNLVTNVKQ